MSIDDLIEQARNRRRELPEPAVRRHLRKRAGISQAAIATAMDPPVQRPTVCRWESGDRRPQEPHLTQYLELLDRLATEVAS